MSTVSRELLLPAQVQRLPEVLDFVETLLEEADCPLRARMQLAVAAEEVFVNIAHYAYAPQSGSALLRAEILDAPRRAVLRFTDSGIPFDPLSEPDPDLSLSLEERQIGGLGIYMTKKTMDELRYRREDGKNVLTLVKRF